ncbi:MAG TPA: hypothetical protein VK772_11720 [Puia sp.]|nr:hypothetical protein [Puia sp.]
MTKKEVVQKIFDCIINRIETFDFKTDLKNQRFVRKNTESIFVYDIHFYNRTNIKTGDRGFLIEPFIWINVKQIENYFKEVSLNKELKTDTDFKTLGNSIAEIISNPDGIHKKWNESLNLFVFNEKDIPIVAKELLKQFEKIALPYFLNNANVETVDKLANSHPEKYTVHMANDNQRIIKGIIAAKLNRNPSLIEVIKIYERQIIEKDMIERVKLEMDRLKNILPMIGVNMTG